MKKKVLCIIAAVVFCLALPVPALANSAGLPYLTILVENPPAGLELSLTVESEGTQKTYPIEGERILWEGCYRFYNHLWSPWAAEDAAQPTAVLQVDTGEESFSLPVEPQGFSFEGNVVTLDLRNQRLLYDQPWWRTPLLIGLRMVLTLALEGAVFWLFGYRQRRSWAVFLLVNLFTQGAVNLALHLLIPTGTDYFVVLGLFFYTPMELLVLVVEIVAFRLLLRERTKGRAAGCAAVANLLSWGLGGLLLACLPI